MNWQDAVSLIIVAVAAAYLGRQAWLMIARKKVGGCGSGCGSCPGGSGRAADGKPLVMIGEIKNARGEPRR
jgi:hypothetical protein